MGGEGMGLERRGKDGIGPGGEGWEGGRRGGKGRERTVPKVTPSKNPRSATD